MVIPGPPMGPPGATMSQLRGGAPAPRSPFPLLPLRTGVLFPGTVITLPVGRKRSLALIESLHTGDVIGVASQRDPKVVDPGRSDLSDMGTFVRVVDIARTTTGEYRLSLEGLGRFTLTRVDDSGAFWQGEGTAVEDEEATSSDAQILADSLREHVQELVSKGGGALAQAAVSAAEPGVFADQVASALGLSTEKELSVLAETNVPSRLRLVAKLLAEAKAMSEVKQKIDADVRQEVTRGQRDAILREQLKAIHRELGDGKDDDDLGALKARLDKAGLSDEARTVADRELARLSGLAPQQAEYNVVRTYLEWIADLPWSAKAEVKDDLVAVAKKLDDDHFVLHDVTKPILQ